MTQNKSDDRINKKTLPQESINFLYTFTRGKKNISKFHLVYLQCRLIILSLQE